MTQSKLNALATQAGWKTSDEKSTASLAVRAAHDATADAGRAYQLAMDFRDAIDSESRRRIRTQWIDAIENLIKTADAAKVAARKAMIEG